MITSAQQRFINKASPTLEKDKRFAGVALGGSYIKREEMDEFSGLDFMLAVRDEFWEDVLRDRVKIAEGLGTLLASFTGEHIQRPDLLICLYDDPLMHVDLNFTKLSDVGERYDDPVILFQSAAGQSGAGLAEELARRPAKVPTPDLQWFEDRFWIWVHFITTRVGRGELFDAIDSLGFLRLNVLGPLISMKNGYPPRGVRHIERDCPGEAEMLAETLAEYNAKSCIRALKAAANLYISLRGVNKASLFLRDKAESRALRYLNAIAERI
jgi:hypothetical protein